jgi:hypothetical protein
MLGRTGVVCVCVGGGGIACDELEKRMVIHHVMEVTLMKVQVLEGRDVIMEHVVLVREFIGNTVKLRYPGPEVCRMSQLSWYQNVIVNGIRFTQQKVLVSAFKINFLLFFAYYL